MALGDVVEIVIIDEGVTFDANHPMHLHGYQFYVVGMDRVRLEFYHIKRICYSNELSLILIFQSLSKYHIYNANSFDQIKYTSHPDQTV